MGEMIPWDTPKRNHGAVEPDFAKIATDVRSRGLPKPGSSGDGEITIQNPSKSAPRTVYVRKRKRIYPPGKPWSIQWKELGDKKEDFFADPCEVIKWLRTRGF